MRIFLPIALTLTALVSTAAEAGDPAAGETVFRRCMACHVVEPGVNRVGPSLHGVVGRQAGTAEGFNRYSASMTAAGEAGLVWEPEQIKGYLTDPSGFLQEYLGDPSARGNMAFKLADGTQQDDVIAYIEQASQ